MINSYYQNVNLPEPVEATVPSQRDQRCMTIWVSSPTRVDYRRNAKPVEAKAFMASPFKKARLYAYWTIKGRLGTASLSSSGVGRRFSLN